MTALAELLNETYLWDYLPTVRKPIVLYGMGNGADEILDRCATRHIPVAGVFASDEFVRGQQFRGFTVKTYKQLLKELGDFVILIAFASELPDILKRFYHLAAQHETYAPHLPLFGDREIVSPQWLRDRLPHLETVYDRLADGASRQTMLHLLRYKLTGRLTELAFVTDRRQDLEQLFNFGAKETFGDLGAYNGDTVAEFLELTNGHYEHIYAVEPDPKNFVKLQHFVELEQLRNCSLLQRGIWRDEEKLPFAAKGGRMSALDEKGKKTIPVTSLDAIIGNKDFTYIKMDVEGAEKEAIEGGQNVIARCQPKLLIAGYHHDDDLWQIPELLWNLVPEYKIYLRRHPYVPCWEINFFVVEGISEQ